MPIFDRVVREKILQCLNTIDNSSDELNGHTININKLDEFCEKLIADNRTSATNKIQEEMGEEISIAYFGALLVGLMAVVVEHDEQSVLPKNWANSTGIPDPNLVMARLLIKLSNSALGVIYLIEAGLESQARAILRVFLELSWLTILVATDQEKMKAYTEANDLTERKIHHEHFTAKKLLQHITEICAQLGYSLRLQEVLFNICNNLYSHYSRTIHNSFAETMIVGSMSSSFDNDTRFQSNLFGQASRGSFPTIYHLNDAFFLLLAMLLKILKQIHRLNHPYSEGWRDILVLHRCFESTIMTRNIPKWWQPE